MAGMVLYLPQVLILVPLFTEKTGTVCGLFHSTKKAQGDMRT